MSYAGTDRDRARALAYYYAHREERAAYRAANLDKCRQWRRDWKDRNKGKQRAAERAWRKAQPWWRPTRAMQKWIKDGLKAGRSGPHRILGWTIADLKARLEPMLKPGMTWGNRGRYGWHIDHIRPLSEFRYVSQDDPLFFECWQLSNLQPLWHWENQAKGLTERRR